MKLEIYKTPLSDHSRLVQTSPLNSGATRILSES